MTRVGVIDYGMGNLRSVKNAFEAIDCDAVVLDVPEKITDVTHLVLPGVGAFGDGMRNLKERNWISAMSTAVLEKGMPFLGICLGMQLLADRGLEHGDHAGLGWIPGEVRRLDGQSGTLRVPHVGWNDAVPVHHEGNYKDGFKKPGVFYFVHSFHFHVDDTSWIDGKCDYGGEFVASVSKDNISAVQFHPEKSQRLGLQILQNFI